MSMNTVAISGNVTRDPELRNTRSGSGVLNLTVAVNDRRKNPQTGEWEDVPNYVDCVLFGRRAEALAPILRKGTKVAIEGKLRYGQWEAQDGTKRSKLEVAVDEIEIMTRGQGQGQQQDRPQGRVVGPGAYQPALQAQPQQAMTDDIPF